MTMRPQNECDDCGYTWYPRGKSLSIRCPNCGSRAVRFPSPLRASDTRAPGTPLLLVGFFAFVLLGCCGGLIGLFNTGFKNDPAGPVAQSTAKGRKDDRPSSEPAPGARSVRERTAEPKPPPPVWKEEPKPPAPIWEEVPPQSPGTEPRKAVGAPAAVDLAPLPRPVAPNRPPAGFVSAWDRLGEVRTRVIGAAIARPVLITDSGEEFRSPDPALLIWVETVSLSGRHVALRRWISPLNNPAALVDTAEAKIKPAKLPTGAWLGGQLKGEHSLRPGGPGVVDVLAFEAPPGARDLWLTLAAAHVGEGGSFLHKIPSGVWAQK